MSILRRRLSSECLDFGILWPKINCLLWQERAGEGGGFKYSRRMHSNAGGLNISDILDAWIKDRPDLLDMQQRPDRR